MTAANPLRGEAALGEHKLVVKFNGWCILERLYPGQKLGDLMVKILLGVDFGVDDLRTYVRVFLDKPMTEEQVGDLIDGLGMVETDVPKELWQKGQPKRQKVYVAAAALREAVEGYRARMDATENPPLAA